MPRRENPIDPADDALAQFALQLRALRRAAGQPSYRDMARTAHYSAPALSTAANGRRMPTWDCVEAYLRACNVADAPLMKQWRHRWEEAVRDAAGRGPSTSDSVFAVPATITSDGPSFASQRSHLPGRDKLDAVAGEPSTAERDRAPDDRSALLFQQATVAPLWSPDTPEENPASQQALTRVTRQMHDPIRIMLVVRTTLLRGGLAAVLSAEDDLEIVAETSSLEQALPVAQSALPAVVIIDPLTEDDLDVVSQFGDALPDCSLLVLAEPGMSPRVYTLFDTRIAAVIAKDTEPRQLCQFIRCVAKGECVFDPALVHALFRYYDLQIRNPIPLTPRELEVLQAIAQGYSNREISAALFLTVKTVEHHITVILRKLAANNRTQAVLMAKRTGWI